MSVMTLRGAMRPGAALARTFLLAADVVAVLIGLLGMHVLSTGSTHHAPVVIGESSHHGGDAAMVYVALVDAATITAPDRPAAELCAEDGCGDDMGAMAYMACVLALLAFSILLAIRPTRSVQAPRAVAPSAAAATPIESPPVPPDLKVLSISRT